jgi:hypothetical protein
MEKEEENNKLQFQKQKDIWPGGPSTFLWELKITEIVGAKSLKSKKFHDAILQVGSVPLNVFETYMDEWANKQSK